MYVQSRGVAELLAGKDSGWESQRRDDGSLPFSSLLRSYGGLTFLGVLAAVMSWSISPALAAWMSPVILGLLLSIPIVMLTSTRAAGRSEEHTSELQSLMRISYAVFCLKKKIKEQQINRVQHHNNKINTY